MLTQGQALLGILAAADTEPEAAEATGECVADTMLAAERCLLAAEAAATSEAQALLAHWGIEVAGEVRQHLAVQNRPGISLQDCEQCWWVAVGVWADDLRILV